MLRFMRDGNMIPFLAAEIPTLANGGIAPDGKSVSWKLKRGVFWSDGQLLTARDVLSTYRVCRHARVAPAPRTACRSRMS